MAPTSPGHAIVGHATRRPQAPALVWRDTVVSYGQLATLAARARTTVQSAPPGGVTLPVGRSPEAVALILGCLLAARRFLLLPIETAPDQVRRLAASAGCGSVRTEADLAGEACLTPPAHLPEDAVTFTLTTSGSTGEPKLVPLTAGAVGRFTDWAAPAFDIDAKTTVLNYAPLHFDLCLLDIWTTLTRGGTVVLVDPTATTRGRYLLDLVARHQVQVVQAVPLFYQLLLDATGPGDEPLRSVQHVIFTGDTIAPQCLADLPALFDRARLHNVYGCTETNDSFTAEIDRATAGLVPVPLGSPIDGCRALIVGPDGGVLDGPGVGELVVSTPFQTTGYLGPTTDDRFGPHPRGLDQATYFRTGDLVCRRADGTVLLEGRTDHIVKVAGVRVNTQEVERILLAHDDVAEAAVLALPDRLAGHVLHAVVRPHASGTLDTLRLRRYCIRHLPRSAVPAALSIVTNPLPRTATGKIDRIRIAMTRSATGSAQRSVHNSQESA